MAHEFVATRLAVVFVANSMAVGGPKPSLCPLAIDGRLQLRDAEVEGFFLCGAYGIAVGAVAAAAANAVAPSSS